MHLNVYIAKSGYCARRKATDLIKSGAVSVNGAALCEPWYDVKDNDRVKVSGHPLDLKKYVYIVFNKPRGVTATLDDRFAEKKIVDCIPKRFGRIYPVGRLDKWSRGLIVLTNDGDLCHQMTHPKFEVEKEYEVAVNGPISAQVLERLMKGVRVEDEFLKIGKGWVISSTEKSSLVGVVVREGKKRHLRRLFNAAGFGVSDLRRIRVGGLILGDLKEGEYRILGRDAAYRLCVKK